MQSRFERIAKQYSSGRTAVATASRWVLTELKSTKARPEWWRMLSPVLMTGTATSFNDWVGSSSSTSSIGGKRLHDNTGIEEEVLGGCLVARPLSWALEGVSFTAGHLEHAAVPFNYWFPPLTSHRTSACRVD
ncbi:hypothetical protein TWF679_007296 [Orbilia oligospora]|uniref:Uncharacterized protein n=1 Tax=Orbilia oligospora TaxID=2813651 RepID=A0A8H8V832_ORBOL|nr:hypothetical protein TWF679_007296 [Orbilia oligospora]